MNPMEYSTAHMQLMAANPLMPHNNNNNNSSSKMKRCSDLHREVLGGYKVNTGYIDPIKFKNEYFNHQKYHHREEAKNGNGLKGNANSTTTTTTLNVSYRMLPNVPLNLMPPPPHNSTVSNNNNINNSSSNNFKRKSGWKSPRNDVRCNSPHGSESDESCRSYKSRDSPPNMNIKGLNCHRARHKHSTFAENTYICNKYCNNSQNVVYPAVINQSNGHYKPKYYPNTVCQQQQQQQQQQHNGLNLAINRKNEKKTRLYNSEIDRRVYGLMERFTSRAHMFKIPSKLPSCQQMNEFESLNQAIWEVYQVKGQKEITYLRKLDLWKSIYLSMQDVLSRYGLFLVGSTMSGLGLDSSDIDICLLVRPYLTDARSDALHHLQKINEALERCSFVRSPEVIMAKVPILKFKDANYGFEVDLNCNNSVGIRNTHLMNCYARSDWRVRPLVAIVKLWAQTNDINDAKRMTISSYSLALMVIQYLQCGVTPPVVPCLQGMYPQMFSPDLEIHDIDIQEDIPMFCSDNKQSLGELLLGFLQYYSYFDYNQYAISVREAALLPVEECKFARAPKNDATQWKLLCIEEPFDFTNTARSVYDVDTFEHIKSVFRLSHQKLHRTKTLSSILPTQR
ncbi:PREDICTED: poly(A) RNA polymerase gld-2 homolog A-like [Nicrophorus vespilloides]|uniref:Poly(A) RNA polymerase gld-2 homolog A-like n=1 Tax=Nicrophorus vespilloides TaxID=110193 RepID=A0ABM1MWZ5_NICVS|nr:PREDICTED: poly(A) RNA polymerase gld-2 homolog A-like [Nicrophorus vespilloides]